MELTLKRNIKILIVEDDELNIKMISSFLKDKYEIEAARSGDEALKKSVDDHFDIFLMDIGLKKEMSGLDVTAKLRKTSEYKNTPIIAITAYALSGDREKILSAGCSHYLSKPFTKQQLLHLLGKIVNDIEKMD
ncbi:MAG: response regulator [Ignavibacteriales bacterium]|nr:response regulator [Ignavibacteriales bacterium]